MQVGTFFPGFHYEEITLSGTRYRLRTGGLAGWRAEPLLLLHGQPQTHAMWHQVAPAVSDRFAVVCADLPSHLTIAELAHDMLTLMTRLGHRRFSVAGHDFGAHVAARIARDAADRVDRLAIVEAVPQLDHGGDDMATALSAYASCWFAQRHPKPEALHVTAPDEWFRLVVPEEDPAVFHPEAVADYLLEGPWNEATRGFGAAADGPLPTLDLEQRLHRSTVSCPVLVVWGTRGRIGGWYDPRALWTRDVSGPIEGGSIESGHFVPEETAWELSERFRSFFGSGQPDPALPSSF